MREELTVNIDERALVPTVDGDQALAFSPGRYRLCFEVASGGMATVYLALYSGPLGFERAVAVKTIHPHLAKEKPFVEMFLDEARIAAHIDHPFVCKVMDFGEAHDSYYIAMEYLVGEPLSILWESLQEKPALAASPDHPRFIARIVADLAEGLHAAHELTEDGRPVGLVHRDVTPANLFVLYDGTVRVVDFGIAKAQNNLHQTETGMVKGKYAYLSPEQLDRGDVDRRSDVFSLGVVLWELLTGKRLFRRESPVETMQAVMGAEIAAPSELREDISPALDAVVLTALERDPERRFATARTMAEALETCLAQEGQMVSRGQLGEWVDEVCPGSFRHKRRLLELTRRGDAAVPMDAPIAPMVAEPTMEPTTLRQLEDEDEHVTTGGLSAARPAADGDELDQLLYAREDDSTGGAVAPAAPAPSAPVPPQLAAPRAPDPQRPRFGPLGEAPKPFRGPSWFDRLKPVAIVILLGVSAGAIMAQFWNPLSDPFAEEAGVSGVQGEAPSPLANVEPTAPSAEDPASPEEPEVAGQTTDSVQEDDDPMSDDEGLPPGLLRVSSEEGGAEVWESGKLLGRTEEQISLAPGYHTLELRPYDGSPPQRLEVEIRSGRTVFSSVALGR